MNQDILQKIVTLRHRLHQNPELSMQEAGTKEILMEFLRENTSFRLADRGEWFYAVKYAGQDPEEKDLAENVRVVNEAVKDLAENGQAVKIAFRADMDALPMEEGLPLPYGSANPGVSHKCGHDGHMAALCGLAMELENCHLTKTVYLIFQPGEEIGRGAYLCKDLLREEGISEIYAYHNLSGYPEGTLLYYPDVTQPASEGLQLRFTGKTSHAAEPEKGNNPAHLIASTVLHAEQLTASGQTESGQTESGQSASGQSHLRLCTVTGIKVGEGDFGISPGSGELCMTLRSDSEPEMKNLEAGILKYAEEKARKSGLQMEYRICDYFPETRNHPECLQKVLQAAEAAGVPAREMDSLWRPSEDFGYYLKECPGAMFYMGNGTDYPPVHTSGYDFNDQILAPVIKVFRKIVMEDPEK